VAISAERRTGLELLLEKANTTLFAAGGQALPGQALPLESALP